MTKITIQSNVVIAAAGRHRFAAPARQSVPCAIVDRSGKWVKTATRRRRRGAAAVYLRAATMPL
jgi:hypothetical protein